MAQFQFSTDTAPTIPRQHIEPSSSTTGTSTTTRARAREATTAAMLHGQYVDCCEYYARAFHRSPAPGIQRELATRIKGGMCADVIRAAIDDTMLAPRPSWAYMAAILRRCDLENIKTLADWNASKMRYQASRNPALNYEQRNYAEDDFGEDFFFDVVSAYGGDQDER